MRRGTQKKRKGSFKKEEKSREKKKNRMQLSEMLYRGKKQRKEKKDESQNIFLFPIIGCVNAICHLFLFSTFFHSSSIMNYLNKKRKPSRDHG